jgi:hypothetical protein
MSGRDHRRRTGSHPHARRCPTALDERAAGHSHLAARGRLAAAECSAIRRRDVDIAYDLVNDLHRVGRIVQDVVCGSDDPDLRQVAEAGWDPTVDTLLASGEHAQHTTRYAFVIDDSHNGENWRHVSGTIDGRVAGAGVEQVMCFVTGKTLQVKVALTRSSSGSTSYWSAC